LKKVKVLISLLALCHYLAINAFAAPTGNITSFNLSDINNLSIGDSVNYYSLKNSAATPPKQLGQLAAWLSTLASHQTTSVTGDKYLTVFEIYNDTPLSNWFIYPYGSVVQNIDIWDYNDEDFASSSKTDHGLNNQQDFHYGHKIKLLPGQHKTLLLLFESEFFFAPVKITIKRQEQAEQLFQLENTLLLLSLGICFALSVYNLFIFFSTRNKQYFSFALATLFCAVGWSGIFGIPEYTGMGRSDYWLIPTFLMGVFFYNHFNIQFLGLEVSTPQTANFLKKVSWVTLISLPFTIYSPGNGLYLVSVLSYVMLLAGIYSGIRCWLNGHLAAKYFVLGLLSILVSNMFGNLMSLGIFLDLNMNTYLLGLMGNSLGSLLLAFALAAQVRALTQKNIELIITLENTIDKRTTELRETNALLEQTSNELIETSNVKNRFIATVSHEIRMPLNSIIGYAYGILLGDINKSEQDRVIRIIAENGNHLLSVVNDILDISEIEANKLDFESIPMPLFSVLAQIESAVGKRARDKSLAFHLDYQYPLPAYINTDPTRLKQILFNLTNNAIKFTERGYIGLSVSLVDQHLQIKVKDSGAGMSLQQQKYLFHPFTQADSSINRRFGGIGLGLNISRQLANGLGGDITVESSLRKGSTFTLSIDFSEVPNSPWINNIAEIWQSTPTQSVKQFTLPNFEGSRVLLADDHSNSRELIAMLLKRMNIIVTEVEDGQQVLETIFHQNFDLILLDIYMPQMDGTEALKQIRVGGNCTPVIALTANNIVHEIEYYLRLGFSDSLAKPVSQPHLISKLCLYLNKQEDRGNSCYSADMLPLIKDYQQDLRVQIVDLQTALEQRDLTIISNIARSIRGSASSFGFDIISQKFTDIEFCALQDDELAVTCELPKAIALIKQCIDLPGVDIAQGIIKHHNSVEQFLKAIFELITHSQQTLKDLTAALNNNEINSALIHLYKFFPASYDCALVQSRSAFKALEDMIKQGKLEPDQYCLHLSIIQIHLAELSESIHPNLVYET
jgi:signal transduction histidine kinase/CheY-like chemotaxis protein